MKFTLGISAYYHDSSAVILKDDEIIAAFQEERFSRIKQDPAFPVLAISNALKQANIGFDDIDLICFYEDGDKKFQRIISTYASKFPKGALSCLGSMPKYLKRKDIKAMVSKDIKKHFGKHSKPIFISEHHMSHAASSFFPSPYENAAILCLDGVGEFATTTAWVGKGNKIKPLWQIDFPHSLGLLYSAFTYYCGFKVDSGEYKLMGLAPYGTPRFVDKIYDNIIKVQEDGTFELDMQFFDYEVGNKMTSSNFDKLFDGPRRDPESRVTQREMDLAASIQVVTEQVVLKLAEKVKRDTKLDYLCLAGGVALNCVSNGVLSRSGLFKEIWVQPASGDAGTALGCAYLGYYKDNKASGSKVGDRMKGAYLGNEYSQIEILSYLDSVGAEYQKVEQDELIILTANALKDNNVIGWFQGRMEFGPRSLGSRSILGNPASTHMQSTLNIKIKNRESFRPFAPSVLKDHANEWFDIHQTSPYMLFVSQISEAKKLKSRITIPKGVEGLDRLKFVNSEIPAVTHVDNSARVQTVDGEFNEKFHKLLSKVNEISGCPVLINTSFNVRGEPIVESPQDAYTCFMRTEMDYLVIGDFILKKETQPQWTEKKDWRTEYELD